MADTRKDESRGMLMGGVIVLGVGVIFLLHNLGIIPEMDVVWPIFPIIVGLALIGGALMRMRSGGGA
jgi:hypothetical protein